MHLANIQLVTNINFCVCANLLKGTSYDCYYDSKNLTTANWNPLAGQEMHFQMMVVGFPITAFMWVVAIIGRIVYVCLKRRNYFIEEEFVSEEEKT